MFNLTNQPNKQLKQAEPNQPNKLNLTNQISSSNMLNLTNPASSYLGFILQDDEALAEVVDDEVGLTDAALTVVHV